MCLRQIIELCIIIDLLFLVKFLVITMLIWKVCILNICKMLYIVNVCMKYFYKPSVNLYLYYCCLIWPSHNVCSCFRLSITYKNWNVYTVWASSQVCMLYNNNSYLEIIQSHLLCNWNNFLCLVFLCLSNHVNWGFYSSHIIKVQ